ncbi:CPBP family intramembrane metalloprotease [Ectothiorhodospiraceae bacterium WFHF3C12]|nr:CPBP family intramembrane metalloprotease [Ectothiorhodospiraceae bacterium WFHF3C12]
MLHYLKYRSSFHATLEWIAPWFDLSPRELVTMVRRHPYGDLFSQAWWGSWHVITYVLIPVLVLKLVLKDRLRDMGLGLGSLSRHWGWYVLLASPILVFVVLASYRPDFVNYYPFYRQAHLSWMDLLLWEAIYLLQFVCLEFFFRGFFIHALRPAMGVNAVFVMCVPYLMIHFPKPWLEATGAILFGLFLGVLSMRSRSIWGGVGVHLAIAAGMDIAALIQGPGLPKTLLRF